MKTEKTITCSYSSPIETFIGPRPTIFMTTKQTNKVSDRRRDYMSTFFMTFKSFLEYLQARRYRTCFIGHNIASGCLHSCRAVRMYTSQRPPPHICIYLRRRSLYIYRRAVIILCICMYVCMYIYIYIYVYICIYMYIYVYIYIYVCI